MVHWGGDINSENIYIEGDNLDALKILRETYLGKVKMIYIDPPYNTGHDFIYKDDFSQSVAEYAKNSGQTDEEGNRLVQNSESNGRFHTDWLNMIYPRLKLARDLLSDDGVIFISIDEHESHNLRKICDEIFGETNYFGDILWESTTQPTNAGSAKFGLQKKTEPIFVYGKRKNISSGFILHEMDNELKYPDKGKYGPCRFEIIEKSDSGTYSRSSMKYKILGQYPREGKRWQIGEQTAKKLEIEGKLEIVDGIVKRAVYPEDDINKIKYRPFWSLFFANEYGTAQIGKEELNTLVDLSLGFDTVKPTKLIKELIFHTIKDGIIIDFFSGSATTAHAVMQLDAEDGGQRKFILVQLPEETDKKSEAYKAGYKTICDIGEERIRRAGKKIKEETGADIDYGFRCFKVDSSNMKDVYYRPDEFKQDSIELFKDNIKEDRKPEDLLIQVMLDLGILLSSKIEEIEIVGKKVYSVQDGYLMACFDKNLTEDIVTKIAKKHPFYAVFRDSSMADDSVAANFEQIFATFSPQTVRKVL